MYGCRVILLYGYIVFLLSTIQQYNPTTIKHSELNPCRHQRQKSAP